MLKPKNNCSRHKKKSLSFNLKTRIQKWKSKYYLNYINYFSCLWKCAVTYLYFISAANECTSMLHNLFQLQ